MYLSYLSTISSYCYRSSVLILLILLGIMRLSKGELHARHPWTQHVTFNETIMAKHSKEEVERLVSRVKEVRSPQ
jgi:hypothetical protein